MNEAMAAWEGHLVDAMAAVEAMPPSVIRIDAPSTVIASIREQLPPGKGPTPPFVPMSKAALYGYGTVRLVEDNDLGRRCVRYHMSDGTIRTERLDES